MEAIVAKISRFTLRPSNQGRWERYYTPSDIIHDYRRRNKIQRKWESFKSFCLVQNTKSDGSEKYSYASSFQLRETKSFLGWYFRDSLTGHSQPISRRQLWHLPTVTSHSYPRQGKPPCFPRSFDQTLLEYHRDCFLSLQYLNSNPAGISYYSSSNRQQMRNLIFMLPMGSIHFMVLHVAFRFMDLLWNAVYAISDIDIGRITRYTRKSGRQTPSLRHARECQMFWLQRKELPWQWDKCCRVKFQKHRSTCDIKLYEMPNLL